MTKIELNKGLITLFDALNFIYKSNKYDDMIDHYQNELSEIYKRIQELKELNKWKNK